MFGYFARLHELHDLPVYPIAVFSHGSRKREPTTYFVEFPDAVVLQFTYAVIELRRLSWRCFLRIPNPVASALMARMKIARRERPLVKLECLRLLATLRLNPAKMQLISGFVDTYCRLSGPRRKSGHLLGVSAPTGFSHPAGVYLNEARRCHGGCRGVQK